MLQATTKAAFATTLSGRALSEKEARQLYGISKAPTTVAKVYGKVMDFDHPEVKTQAFWGILPDGRLVQANSYDGTVGRNWSADKFTTDHPGEKEFAKRLGLNKKTAAGDSAPTYSEIQVSEWPEFFVPVAEIEGGEGNEAAPTGEPNLTGEPS